MKLGLAHIMGLAALISLPFGIFGQPTSQKDSTERLRVKILNAQQLTYSRRQGEPVKILQGRVAILQDSTYFYCDSAFQYERSNKIEAIKNVRVIMPSGVSLRGDRLTYDARSRIAQVFGNITLSDRRATLKTKRLTYFRNGEYGYYTKGGVLTDPENKLESRTGYYYSRSRKALFYGDVILTNPDFVLTADSLGYLVQSRTAEFIAPTEIVSDMGELRANRGTYATRSHRLYLTQRAIILDSAFTLISDTLDYNDSTGLGAAWGNIIIRQADSSLEIRGGQAEFDRRTEQSLIYRNPVAIQFMNEDTLFVLADTLYTYTELKTVTIPFVNDSSVGPPPPPDMSPEISQDDDSVRYRNFLAYPAVSFFMNDLQGQADSMAYNFGDSLIQLFDNPFLWSEENQLNGDTIIVRMRRNEIDSMWVGENSFLVSRADTVGFNQIKGREMIANFVDNQIRRLHIIGNAESIYFIEREGDSTKKAGYEGVNEALAQEMKVFFEDNQVVKILFLTNPEGTFYPMYEAITRENRLTGMQWRGEERPQRPEIEFDREPIPVLSKATASTRPEKKPDSNPP